MKCPHCNNKIDNDSKFCPFCGKEILKEKVCPKCGQKNSLSSSFCKKCGTPLNQKEVEEIESTQDNKEDTQANNKPEKKTSFIFQIISMSLMLLSLLLVFSLSFAPLLKSDFYPMADFTMIGFFLKAKDFGFGTSTVTPSSIS